MQVCHAKRMQVAHFANLGSQFWVGDGLHPSAVHIPNVCQADGSEASHTRGKFGRPKEEDRQQPQPVPRTGIGFKLPVCRAKDYKLQQHMRVDAGRR